MEMNRIDGLIANPNFYYDPDPVEGFIAFCETEMTLTDGSDVVLLPSFKLWAEQIFCWYYFTELSIYEPGEDGELGHYVTKVVKKRLTVKQYLIVARGAAKSLYESFLQAYFLNCDVSTTHQITTAPTMRPKTAQVVVRGTGTEVTPAVPTFNTSTGVLTVPSTTGVVYKNQDTDATLTAGAQTAIASGATVAVVAVPASGYYFPHNFDADWEFTRS